ncbi:MAG TPA: hypothetical protein VGE24_11570 [Emticicia sp.]
MTISEFNSFEHQKKSDTLWEWGYFINKQRVGNVCIAVFSLNDFFVELAVSARTNDTLSIVAVTESLKNKRYREEFKKICPHLSYLPTEKNF